MTSLCWTTIMKCFKQVLYQSNYIMNDDWTYLFSKKICKGKYIYKAWQLHCFHNDTYHSWIVVSNNDYNTIDGVSINWNI